MEPKERQRMIDICKGNLMVEKGKLETLKGQIILAEERVRFHQSNLDYYEST